MGTPGLLLKLQTAALLQEVRAPVLRDIELAQDLLHLSGDGSTLLVVEGKAAGDLQYHETLIIPSAASKPTKAKICFATDIRLPYSVSSGQESWEHTAPFRKTPYLRGKIDRSERRTSETSPKSASLTSYASVPDLRATH